jgi:hypothetical protein
MQIFNYRLVKIRLFFDTQHFCTFQKKNPLSQKTSKNEYYIYQKVPFFCYCYELTIISILTITPSLLHVVLLY